MDSSSSDLEEELPVFDFLLQPDRSHQAPFSRAAKPDVVVLDGSDTEIPASSSPVSDRGGPDFQTVCGGGEPEVKMISSDEEDAPYVPLAQRLKQKQEAVTSLFINGPSPPEYSAQSAFSESEPPLPLYDPEEGSMAQVWPPPKHSSWTGSTSTSPAKKRPPKRTHADIQTSREEALRRREARERTEGGKETRKQQQEREKEERKALAQAAKALRPEECIKHMVACVDPALLQQEGGATLLASLQALGCSCAIEKQPLPRCVSWTRKPPCTQPGPQAGVPEALAVLQIPVEQFITLVHSSSQEQRGVGTTGCPSLTSWILDLMDRNPGRTLSLVVIDLETYFKSQKSQSQKKLCEAVLGEEPGTGAVKKKSRKKKDGGGEGGGWPDVSRVDLEEALVHLQLHAGVQVRFLHTWADFCQHVAMTTKAVAEAPFKRAREQTGFSFCVESECGGGRKGARGAGGLHQVWSRQIQQLNRVSPDMASAILATYPSPLLLRQAYRKCRSEQEGLSLLSDLMIRRGEGVTATTRRIGPELSRRLFLLMTSSDPQQILDSTV